MDNQITIVQIANGWIVILPYMPTVDRQMMRMVDLVKDAIEPKSEIQKIIAENEMQPVPDYESNNQSNQTFFPTLKEALAFISLKHENK